MDHSPELGLPGCVLHLTQQGRSHVRDKGPRATQLEALTPWKGGEQRGTSLPWGDVSPFLARQEQRLGS